MVFIGPPPDAIRAWGQDRARGWRRSAVFRSCRHGIAIADAPKSPPSPASSAIRGWSRRRPGAAVRHEHRHWAGPIGGRSTAYARCAARVRRHAVFSKVFSPSRAISRSRFRRSDGRLVHLVERECSLQRRYPEDRRGTPSPAVTPNCAGGWARPPLTWRRRRLRQRRHDRMHGGARAQILLPRDEHPSASGASDDRAGDGIDLVREMVPSGGELHLAARRRIRCADTRSKPNLRRAYPGRSCPRPDQSHTTLSQRARFAGR